MKTTEVPTKESSSKNNSIFYVKLETEQSKHNGIPYSDSVSTNLSTIADDESTDKSM